jgi:hypothetical protein
MEKKTEFHIEDGVLLRYQGYENHIVIPEGVTAIGDWAFYGSSLRSVSIPDTVVSIGENAFALCAYIETVEIPPSVLRIASFAFYRCKNLRTVMMADNVRSIGGCAFKECGWLQTVRISEKILKIGQEAFACCPSLQTFRFGGKFKIVRLCFEDYFNKTISPETAHLVLRNPSDFHAEDIVYTWEKIYDRYGFKDWMASLTYPELLTMEQYGFITKENALSLLELLRANGNVECVGEMIRHISENQILGDYTDRFRLEL